MQVINSSIEYQSALDARIRLDNSDEHLSIYIPVGKYNNSYSTKLRFENASKKILNSLFPGKQENTINQYITLLRNVIPLYQNKQGIRGLALFKSKSQLFHSGLQHRTPEMACVGDHFELTPLIKSIATLSSAFVITVSARQITVYLLHGDHLVLEKIYTNPHYVSYVNTAGSSFPLRAKKRLATAHAFIDRTIKSMQNEFQLNHQYLALIGKSDLREYMKLGLHMELDCSVFYEARFSTSIGDLSRKISSKLFDYRMTKNSESGSKTSRIQPSLMTHRIDDIIAAAVQGRVEHLAIDPYLQSNKDVHYLSHYIGNLKHRTTVQSSVLSDITKEIIKANGRVTLFDSSKYDNIAPFLATLRW